MQVFTDVDVSSNIELMSTLAVQPKNYKVNLYPHQLCGISMMENREYTKKIVVDDDDALNNNRTMNIESNVGIYADITGYGKTATVIGMLVRDKMEWNESELYIHKSYIMHYGDGRILATEDIPYERISCNLILASQTIIKQWEKELSATNLQFCIISTKKQITGCDPNDFDVIVISPTMYNQFMSHYNGRTPYPFAWKRFIFDEPQNTNISTMKPIMAGFNWFITATPQMMLNKSRNRNSFITNMFHFGLHRPIFDALIVKNSDSFVRQSYTLPETVHRYYDTYQPLCNIVRGIASESVTKMLEADNIAGAIKLLGGTLENTGDASIFDLLKKRKTDELEDIQYKINRYRERGDSVKEDKWKSKHEFIKQQLTNLQQRIDNISAVQCVICTDTCTKPVMTSGCCHIFCGTCILTWLKSNPTCPVCRYRANSNELIYIDTSKTELSQSTRSNNNDSNKILTKQQTVAKIIKDNPSGKFIIFSGFEETFVNIRACLNSDGIKYGEILGKKENREAIVNQFKHGNIKVLFLNSINSGDGLNLQEATDIILYHNVSTGLETQILGRANRIGRNIDLSVHHLN
jgi:hypothetical protein